MKNLYQWPTANSQQLSFLLRNFLFFIILILAAGLHSQSIEDIPYRHPELEWRTIETAHFYVHFHQGTERTASVVAKIAEDIYQPVTDLYNYKPDGKIHFIVRDHDDNANGAAYYYNNKVEIWAPPADFLLRSDHDWLRNVVTHEFSHMISLGASRKMHRLIPAIYFQWMGFEPEKREDVLHGYPNKLISMPWAGTVIPMWFAEGMAQFQRDGFDYDHWDAHRDMLLRTAALEGELLSLNEMGIFGKNSLGNERTYCQGFALTTYIAQQFGEEKLGELTQVLKNLMTIDFSRASKQVLGLSDRQLYDRWKTWLTREYQAAIQTVQDNQIEGKIIQSKGLANVYPAWSPDGKKLAFLSNAGEDYLSLRSLYVMDMETGKKRVLKAGVSSSAAWSPDGEKLVYAKKKKQKHGSHFFDLFVYSIAGKKAKRITKGKRARLPHWSADGQKIVCVVEADGTSNLATLNPDGTDFKVITTFQNGEQITFPKWAPDSKSIVFAMFSHKGERDIAHVNADGTHLRYIFKTEFDTRDPMFSPDGKFLYYSANPTGIFNIYRKDLDSESTQQITNVVGGAFMPTVNSDGSVVFATFQHDGYKLAKLDSVVAVPETHVAYTNPYAAWVTASKRKAWPITQYNDFNIPEYQSQPYSLMPSKLSFMPRLLIDYPDKPKVGSYFYGADVLDKLSLFGGFGVNTQWDTDAFLMFTYDRSLIPFFLELYHIRRHFKEGDYNNLITFMEADIGTNWKLSDMDLLRTAFQYSRYRADMENVNPKTLFSFAYTYHKGAVFQAKWTREAVGRHMFFSIAPDKGYRLNFDMQWASNQFHDDFKIHEEYGTLVPVFSKYNYFQITGDVRNYFSLPFETSMMLKTKLGLIDRQIDDFYYLYAGGMDGLKGYPFYSIEGRKLLQADVAFRFPIWQKTGKRFLFLNFDNIYGSIYGQVGDAFSYPHEKMRVGQFKRTVGMQLRMDLRGFYAFPLKFFADAAYGLDSVQKYDRVAEIDRDYGKEWRFYFGLLFDYLD